MVLVTVVVAVTAVFVYGAGSNSEEEPLTALIVVGEADDVLPGDRAMANRISEVLGYETELRDDDQVTDPLDSGYDLVVVSKSVESEKISDKFKSFEGGFWTFEDNLQPISVDGVPMMALVDETDPSATAWHADTATWYVAEDAGERLSLGLQGAIDVYESTAESTFAPPETLGTGATMVVEMSEEGDGRSPYYVYETGAILADGTPAAGRRVFFGLYHTESDTTFEMLTPEGLALFDASIEWAASSGR